MIDIINKPRVKKHITVKVYEKIIQHNGTWSYSYIDYMVWVEGIPYNVFYV